MPSMQATVAIGDALRLPLGDKTVQTCVTSPPYFGIHDYGVDGQIGAEDSLPEFLASMVGALREVWRVLRDDGTVWLNMGDTYGADKCKLLVPHRLAIELSGDGWVVRQDIARVIPNSMPGGVDDRPSSAHDYLFLLAKSPRYYYDPGSHDTATRRSAWSVASKGYPGAHFSTFPTRLVTPCVAAGTSQRACPGCGACWSREVEVSYDTAGRREGTNDNGAMTGEGYSGASGTARHYQSRKLRRATTTGWSPGCECAGNDGSGKALVLDPFCGSGTTGVVSAQMGRSFFGVELNPEYAAMARDRIREEGLGMSKAIQAGGVVHEQQVLAL